MATAAQVNERLAKLTEAGTSVWLDQIRRSLIESGRAAAAGGRGLAARRDLQPGDLREGHPRLRRLRRGHREARGRGPRRGGDLPRHRDQGRADGVRRDAPGARGDRRQTASCRSRSSRRWRTTPRARSQQAARAVEGGRPPERDDQDPGHRGGPAGDRGRDRRRHQRERDAAVQRRVLRDGDRGLHQGPGAPPRGRRVARRALRGQLLRLARGLRGGQAPRGARPRGPAGPGGDRQRPGRLPELQADLPRRPLRRAARCRRARCSARCGRRPA